MPERVWRHSFTALWILVAVATVSAQSDRKVTKIADGVYAIEHGVGPDRLRSGNSTVIIGDRQVLVVDSCFLPAAAREDIQQIRQWTNNPVAFVVNTHFHNDHNLGNRVYMDAFPALTVIAQTETKKSMDMYGPGTLYREEKGVASLKKMNATGKSEDGQELGADDKALVASMLHAREPVIEELKNYKFQSATMTFDRELDLDLGNREVQVKFLGRGNTAGDAIVYLPKEKIVVAGDLVAYPVPNMSDGYPSEWPGTMENLMALDASTIVPGHGPVMHDKAYVQLVHDLLKSANEQVDAKLRQGGPPMFQGLDPVKAAVDLSSFRSKFAGNNEQNGARFDAATSALVKLLVEEAGLR